MATTSCVYRIPRKRKYCVYIYDGQIFQYRDQLIAYLTKVKHFSDKVAELICHNVNRLQVDETEMKRRMKDLDISKKTVSKYLSGTLVK